MVSSNFKKAFEVAITKLIKPLVYAGLNPNIVTTLGLITSIAAGYCYYLSSTNLIFLALAGILVLFSGFLDAIDGTVARISGNATTLGGFYDSVADRYSDASALIGIIISGLCIPIIGLTALVGSLLVSYTRSRAESEGVKMSGVGIAERAERMIILTLATFAEIFIPGILNYGIGLIATLSHLTVIQRALFFRKKVK